MFDDPRQDPPQKVFVRATAPVDDAEALRMGYELFDRLVDAEGAAGEQSGAPVDNS